MTDEEYLRFLREHRLQALVIRRGVMELRHLSSVYWRKRRVCAAAVPGSPPRSGPP